MPLIVPSVAGLFGFKRAARGLKLFAGFGFPVRGAGNRENFFPAGGRSRRGLAGEIFDGDLPWGRIKARPRFCIMRPRWVSA